jgi:hypothetical protein
MQLKEFKIRCSAIGQIMTNGRSKSEPLGQTAKSYCERWVKEQVYNRRYEFSSKYTEKGIEVEQESIDFIARELGLGMLMKNEFSAENSHMTGTADIVTADLIIDMKNSWDCFTFPLFESTPEKPYWWQVQGYMALYDKPNAVVAYTLMDTPEHIIEREAWSWCRKNGMEELDGDVYYDFASKMTYTDIDPAYRIKIFRIERDQEAIDSIYTRVEECRTYINSIILCH